jgi:hypothetical protein
MPTKKRLILLLKFAVSGLLIWFILGKIDLAEAFDQIANMDAALALLALVIVYVQLIPATLRWTAVLDAIGAPLAFLTALRLFFIGIFFNQALPSSVGGDAVRIYVAHREGLTLRGAVNGVMLERAATVVALVLVVAAMQPQFQARVDDEAGRLLVPALALLALALAGGLAFLMFLDRLPLSLQRWRLVRGIGYLAGDTRRVFLAPGPMAKTVAWAAIGHVNISFAVFVLARSLDIETTLIDCLALVPLVILVTTLPISIAGWGVREGAMVVAFGLIGVAGESAVVLSVMMGIMAIVGSLPGGVLWLLSGESRKAIPDAVPDPSDAAG